MKLTTKEVKKLLIAVLADITGLDPSRVIWEATGGSRPSEGLYCSLWWRSFEPLAQNQGEYRDNDESDGLIQNLRNETLCAVQISFWGSNAFDTAAFTVGALQNDNRIFDLWRVLGYGGIDSIQDISTAFGGQIQKRCFFNLSFYACFGADYPVDWFDSSQWSIRSSGHDNDFTYSKIDGEIPAECGG
jgi:hypothetical protein